jgi:RNA polymerase sigma-70 factor (ECF subfamily)
MSEITERIQSQLDRLQEGDKDARRQLFNTAYVLLEGMARRVLARFPAMKNLHDPHSVIHDAFPLLNQALSEVKPQNCAAFFSLVNMHLRRRLLDLIDYHEAISRGGDRKKISLSDAGESVLSANDENESGEPSLLASSRELLVRVDRLPDPLRPVVELLVFQGASQAEAAEILGVHEDTAKRYWREAREALGAVLNEADWMRPARFRLTQRSLEALDRDGIPNHILAKLERLAGRGFDRHRTLVNALSKVLTADEVETYGRSIRDRATTRDDK